MNRISKTWMILIFGFILNSSLFQFSLGQVQKKSEEEQQVLETIQQFKTGIEQGDLELGQKITTENFYPFFKGFYESSAT